MLNRVSRCRSPLLSGHPWSLLAKLEAKAIINALRPQFIIDCKSSELWQGEVLAGHWVNDDGHVLWMLQSNATEEQYKHEPFTWVQDALQACAEHDWLVAEKIHDELRRR